LEEIGHGGFGAVYRVRYKPTDQERALKVIPKPSDAEHLRLLLNEAQLLVSLDHPNIMKLYEIFEDARCLCLVTELCDGGDFSELDVHADDPDEVRLLFRDVVGAIAYCHNEGVAHRDLKFENCLIMAGTSSQRRVGKVIDFGLAAIRRAGRTEGKWMSDGVGTLHFAAPEVVECEYDYSRYGLECDMWSIGVMLYIVLTDQHPVGYAGVPKDEYISRIRRCRVNLAPLESAAVDRLARDLVQKLLVKAPAGRLSALEALKHQWLSHADSPAGLDATPRRAFSIPRTPHTSKSSLRTMIGRAGSFAGYSRFEQAVLTLAAHEAQSEEVEDLRAAFVALDTARAGWLSRDDFCAAIAARGIRLNPQDLRSLLGGLDPDGDGTIQYTEWLAATLEPAYLSSERAVRELFDFFDLHGTGRIWPKDLREVLGAEVAEAVVWRAGQGSPDESLSLDDFRRLMQDTAGRLESRSGRRPPRSA
jgi:calcium-dependent protein kinase